MIQPINEHVLIEPVKYKTYLPTEKGMYEEVGIVIDGDLVCMKREKPVMAGYGLDASCDIVSAGILEKGDKVYFDAWLASKYPTGKDDEFFWLVKFADIKAVEKQNGKNSVSE
jgi:co-chaperonin GroES (HSP10)